MITSCCKAGNARRSTALSRAETRSRRGNALYLYDSAPLRQNRQTSVGFLLRQSEHRKLAGLYRMLVRCQILLFDAFGAPMLCSRERTSRDWLRILMNHCAKLMASTLTALLLIVLLSLSRDARCEEAVEARIGTTPAPTASPKVIRSGPEVGSTIHQFFVRAVTGPHRNRSVCYVCRYGSRPVVMVFIQKSDPKIATLLKAIDVIVDENRVSGLRSFGVLVTDESSRAVPILQTMAFDERIRLPLTAATTAVAGPSCHNLHKDAATTVVLYRNQQAVQNFAFARGAISEKSIAPLIQSVEKLIDPAKPE